MAGTPSLIDRARAGFVALSSQLKGWARPVQLNVAPTLAPQPRYDAFGQYISSGLPKRPVLNALRDIPANAFSAWTDDVTRASVALGAMERTGNMSAAALLADAMLEDDRIAGVFTTRVNGLLGLDSTLEPRGDKRSGGRVVNRLQDQFPEMFQVDQLGQVLRSGLMMGIGVAEKIWRLNDDGELTFTLKAWNNQFLRWQTDTRSFWMTTQDGQVEVPEDGGGRWLVYCPFGYYRGWNFGLIRALKLPYLFRQLAYRDWARYSEVHGSPIKAAIVPPDMSNPGQRDRFLNLLKNLGGEPVVELEQGASDGTKYDLKLIEAQANTWQGFEGMVKQADASIAITILGQNLTTEVSGGSHAAASVHDTIRHDLMAMDALTLSQAIRRTGLCDWALYNEGSADQAPNLTWDTDPPADQQKAADTLQKLGSFATSAKTAGIPVDFRALAEQYEIPVVTPEQEAADKAEAAQKAADALQAQQDKAAGAPPADGQGNEQKLTRLGRQGSGQDYVDQVVEAAVKRAAQAVQLDLASVIALVQTTTTPDELKSKLLRLYPHMDPTELEQVVERAGVMAALAGQTDVPG